MGSGQGGEEREEGEGKERQTDRQTEEEEKEEEGKRGCEAEEMREGDKMARDESGGEMRARGMRSEREC